MTTYLIRLDGSAATLTVHEDVLLLGTIDATSTDLSPPTRPMAAHFPSDLTSTSTRSPDAAAQALAQRVAVAAPSIRTWYDPSAFADSTVT